MRILAVSPYYEPEGGGLERYAHAILGRLASRGHQVEALAFTKDGACASTQDGVEVERLVPRLRLGNTPIDLGFRRRVRDAIRRFSPDLVLAHTPVPFPAEMAYRAARHARVPFVATYHSGQLRGSTPALETLARINRWTFERQMLAGAARLIAVGPYVRDHALRRHPERVTIVPPGVDVERFTPQGEPEGHGILFVGPLSDSYRWKGIDILWAAYPKILERVPRARLTIVGDGDRMDEFRRKAAATGGSVRLLGRLPEEQLIEEYRRAAVIVLPSTTDAESFGMVLAEANACGRPVVASRIGGIPDFVRDGDNGLLARPADAADLAEKIATVLRDPAQARSMGQRGRDRVVSDHNWDALATATEQVLEAAVTA